MITRASTTKMSSKGQVVIPEAVRAELGLESGCQFLVLGENDAVILKTISPPSKRQFRSLIARARKEAKKAGLRPEDVAYAVKKVRGRK